MILLINEKAFAEYYNIQTIFMNGKNIFHVLTVNFDHSLYEMATVFWDWNISLWSLKALGPFTNFLV